jgi:secreted Zn-dependent insulinase-like peptidase
MTYKYDPALSDEVSLVRFHIGDTSDKGHYLENETIQYFISADGWKKAVIVCIRYIITQLSSPDFKQDWLDVSNSTARKGYEQMLKDKQIELGIGRLFASSSVSLPTRADSYQTDNDYKEVQPSDDLPFDIG